MKRIFLHPGLILKLLLLLLSALLIMGVCAGCGARNVVQQQDELLEPAVPPVPPEVEAFFANYVNTSERPVAVMIDNDDKNARPHAGLNDAYLIYEVVVEGGATRFMALFRGADTPKLGPVRSSRHYFLDFALEHDAIYTHFGWSPRAQQDIAALGVNNINGVLGVDAGIYWREEKFKGDWHSAFTNIEKIHAHAEKKGYRTETDKTGGIRYAEDYITATGTPAQSVQLRYSGRYRTGYTYNAATGLYEKSIDGAPHVMQSGEVLSVKNILVQFIADYDLGDGSARRNMTTTGSGKGYYITDGLCEEITWSKSARNGATTYKKADGTDLLINPGKTIVNIISPTSEVAIQ